MSAFEVFQAVVLGLVEGLTEFLPISSTGHLIVAGDLLKYTGDQAKTFSIVIQLGAILAVCWHYRDRLQTILATLLENSTSQRLVFHLFLAICPSALFGLALNSTPIGPLGNTQLLRQLFLQFISRQASLFQPLS